MSGWIAEEQARVATDRILDAAADLFVEHGVAGVGMREIARAAGCSRATVYRYFADRAQLQQAFVHREARRVGAAVVAEVGHLEDAEQRLTAAVLAAVRRVRAAPTLAAWFRGADAAASADLALSSAVIGSLGATEVPDVEAARWVVRVIVSLLTLPGRDDAEEEAMVARFVAPVVARPVARGASRRTAARGRSGDN